MQFRRMEPAQLEKKKEKKRGKFSTWAGGHVWDVPGLGGTVSKWRNYSTLLFSFALFLDRAETARVLEGVALMRIEICIRR